MQSNWRKFQGVIGRVFGLITDWALFSLVVVLVGLGTSWYMVEAGSSLTTQRIGPWLAWTAQARSDADPYTRAHFARRGTVDLSSETALSFVAHGDDSGTAFRASCVYRVTGRDIDATWWSLTLFDGRGQLIANAAERYTFTRDTTALSSDGNFTISMSRDVKDGNWLPFGNANSFILVLQLLQPDISLLEQEGNQNLEGLPSIKRISC